MRRRRTPESEAAAIRRYARAVSAEGRANFVPGYYAMAETYDLLSSIERERREGMETTDGFSPGTKRTAARRANAYARQAAIYRASAFAYGLQVGPIEPEGLRNG